MGPELEKRAVSRAVNPGAPVRKLRPSGSGKSAAVQPARPQAPRYPSPLVPAPPAITSSAFHKVGLICCCGYLFSGYGNDLSIHVFGGKAYLSWIFGSIMLVCFIGCGTALRGLKSSVGKYWGAVILCLLFSSAFSIWRGESVGLIKDFFPKVLFVYFYCTAFALSLRDCRTLIKGNMLCIAAILLSAALFGSSDDGGRLAIPDSFFLGNPNDLALALVSSLGFTLFLIWQKSMFVRILGTGEFLITLLFLLKTGSRGGFLALTACLISWFIFANHRGRLVALAVPALCLIVILPGSTLSRLVLIAMPGTNALAGADSADVTSQQAMGSQAERTAIFQRSISIALHHPLFGTGPGTFMDALWDEDVAKGTHTHAIGTHNTYTQVAAEWGFPAFLFYIGILGGSISLNVRIMRQTRKVPGAEPVFSMALCLIASLVAFGVGSAFDHVAYSLTLPILSGISAALGLASHNGDPAWIASQVAAGNV